MKGPRPLRAAIVLVAILAVSSHRADAQERAQRTGYWGSLTFGTGLGGRDIGSYNLVRRSRSDRLVALSFAGTNIDYTPHRVAGDTSSLTHLNTWGVSLGRWWPRQGYAMRALGGLAYASKVRSKVVHDNSGCGKYRDIACPVREALASGPALTGSLGADWTRTRVIWFGAELNAMASTAGAWLGIAASISLGRRD